MRPAAPESGGGRKNTRQIGKPEMLDTPPGRSQLVQRLLVSFFILLAAIIVVEAAEEELTGPQAIFQPR
jgi:hypothetical protein